MPSPAADPSTIRRSYRRSIGRRGSVEMSAPARVCRSLSSRAARVCAMIAIALLRCAWSGWVRRAAVAGAMAVRAASIWSARRACWRLVIPRKEQNRNAESMWRLQPFRNHGASPSFCSLRAMIWSAQSGSDLCRAAASGQVRSARSELLRQSLDIRQNPKVAGLSGATSRALDVLNLSVNWAHLQTYLTDIHPLEARF